MAKVGYRQAVAFFFWLLGAVAFMIGFSLGRYGIGQHVIAAGLIAGGFATWWSVGNIDSPERIQALFLGHRTEKWNRHTRSLEEWRSAHAKWNASEAQRFANEPIWFPVRLTSPGLRIDVFGGTPTGWAQLLCTFVTSKLGAGESILVVDMTEEDVAGAVCEIARRQGKTTVKREFPADLESAGLMDGLDARSVAAVIAESVDSLRHGGSNAELRLLDSELIRAVLESMGHNVTFRRIAAGLNVLLQNYDAVADGLLLDAEFEAIARRVDSVTATDRNRNELQFLRMSLESLLVPDRDITVCLDESRAQAGGVWPSDGLICLSTLDPDHRRRDLLDRIIMQLLLHDIGSRTACDRGSVLIVAGADHVGLETLELLDRRCRRAGLRLVLMFQHLRGAPQDLIGGGDSSTVFMQLGNGKEAAEAAEFIGRGHSFKLTQLTRDGGRSYTSGTGIGSGESWSESRSATQVTDTRGGTKEWTASTSWTKSQSEGLAFTRVYDFTVEPSTIQSMDSTSFLIVEAVGDERRVLAGTCDPFVASLARTARHG